MTSHIRTPDQRLRVFISSTLGELADERTAARAAVEQLCLIPVMFELGARAHPPRALYRSYLAQSDVFVGIYWERYGWVAPDMEISGLEDEMVLSHGMPRLLYVKRPAPEQDPRLREMLDRLEGEDSACYRPFSTVAELHDLLANDLAVLLTERFADNETTDVTGATPPHHKLPAQMSTFVGRAAELEQLRHLIVDPAVRLITLRGPGGTGKTRLAGRVATELVDRFSDGVQFVDISAERDPNGVFAAVARALGVSIRSGASPVESLKDELRERSMLLILDNFEQAASAAVGVVDIVEHCENVTVLVTSREALRVRGEFEFAVHPLSLPNDAESAEASEAVQLFCDRAASVRTGFALTADNAQAVTDICWLLDGLPLAIELAAARLQLFEVDEILDRLLDRYDVLRNGARDLPKRQQTLRNAIDWSYELLDEGERQMFRVMAAFSSPRLADIEASVSHCTSRMENVGDLDVVEQLGSLVAKSLVHRCDGSDGRPRFSMLRTIRAYAIERLEEDPEFASAVRAAHAEQYSDVAKRLHTEMSGSGRSEALAAVGDALVDLRTAWKEWVERANLWHLKRMLASLWCYYDARGDYRATIELGTDLLDCLTVTPDSAERRRDEFAVRMCLVRTQLAVSGYTAESEQLILDALERSSAAGDGRHRFPSLRSLAYLHQMNSDFERVGVVARELLALAEEEDDRLMLSEAHLLTGLSTSWQVDLPTALEHYRKAVEYAESAGSGKLDFGIGTHPAVVASAVQALTQWMVGTPDTARVTMDRAIRRARDLEHPYSMAFALHHAALLDLWCDDMAALAARTRSLRQLAEEHDYPVWRALSLVLGGLADVRSGQCELGLTRSEEGFRLYQGVSAPPVFWPALQMIRSMVLRAAGRSTDALAVIEEAVATARDADPMVSDIAIAHGELLLETDMGDTAAAEAVFQRVVTLAESRGYKLAQVRALTNLVTIRRGTHHERHTLDALEAAYDACTEGFDLPQLIAAREMLGAACLDAVRVELAMAG